jgi:hypothetical protein
MAKLITPAKANRLARAIASDIAAYNEAAILKALADDKFFEAMAEELEEGRVHYESRVDESILATSNYFQRAIIDVIIRPQASTVNRRW